MNAPMTQDAPLVNFRSEMARYAAMRTTGPSPNLRDHLRKLAQSDLKHISKADMDALMAEIDRAAGY